MEPRDRAHRKFMSLSRMTVQAGCTSHEAATAQRLAVALGKRWGFIAQPAAAPWREGFEQRAARAEQRAATRFRWEYRRCGKPRCHCSGKGSQGHGPYRYSKKREGKKVRSVYLGR